MVLLSNVIRVLHNYHLPPLLGYYFFGLYGFLWFNLAATIPLLMYFYWEQKRSGLLNVGTELKRMGDPPPIGGLFFCALGASQLVSPKCFPKVGCI